MARLVRCKIASGSRLRFALPQTWIGCRKQAKPLLFSRDPTYQISSCVAFTRRQFRLDARPNGIKTCLCIFSELCQVCQCLIDSADASQS